ncbi:hypothetical protein NSA53_01085 [Cellulosimicrobium cellulans]|uniref:hypothetical protein n=1 Tax=Cellulosimicrobium cellulans TaxID=1710 RepID=UPI00088673FC|nr:hypothetical protein [Cellulosimicrobium cellulans]SDF10995.1 hypothetical protein SAMN04487781_0310 [Cellulosimicrobium cellulans]
MSSVLRFRGRIAGWGTASGTRVVVGRWDTSPFGAFADVMVERPDGERILLAPSRPVAELVASTYRFDRVVLVPVAVTDEPAPVAPAAGRDHVAPAAGSGRLPDWHVVAGPLEARLAVGPRTFLGHVLRAVPHRVATSRHATVLTDPVARVLLRGVRTRGSAGPGRTEHYGATDVHALLAARTRWDGGSLGGLRDVVPPVLFGFGSTPPRPSVTDVVTTIVVR